MEEWRTPLLLIGEELKQDEAHENAGEDDVWVAHFGAGEARAEHEDVGRGRNGEEQELGKLVGDASGMSSTRHTL